MNMMQRFDKTFASISEQFPGTMELVKTFYAKEFLSLRERVEGLRKECPNHKEGEKVECYGYDEYFNEAINAVLRIIDET